VAGGSIVAAYQRGMEPACMLPLVLEAFESMLGCSRYVCCRAQLCAALLWRCQSQSHWPLPSLLPSHPVPFHLSPLLSLTPALIRAPLRSQHPRCRFLIPRSTPSANSSITLQRALQNLSAVAGASTSSARATAATPSHLTSPPTPALRHLHTSPFQRLPDQPSHSKALQTNTSP
jgi:hypothetical protein